MEKEILNFITERLKAKGLVFVLTDKPQKNKKETWFRFWFKGNDKKHIFTVLENTQAMKKSWYKSTYLDEGMSRKEKDELMTETLIDEAIKEYFLQTFDIAGKSWLLRWS